MQRKKRLSWAQGTGLLGSRLLFARGGFIVSFQVLYMELFSTKNSYFPLIWKYQQVWEPAAGSWRAVKTSCFLKVKSTAWHPTFIPHCWWEVGEKQQGPLPSQSTESFLLKYPSAALNAAREQTSLKRHFHDLTSCCFATHVINSSSFPLLDARHSEQDVFHLLLKGSQVTP